MPNDIRIPLPSLDPRLGRNINHDARSALYEFPTKHLELVDADHSMHIPTMDQGSVGKCTAEMATETLAMDPFWATLPAQVQSSLGDSFSDAFYHDETVLDPYNGVWPPTDTGSDGLSAAKVAVNRGLIAGYQHTFSGDAARKALGVTPIGLGMLWKEGCDSPSSTGEIKYTGAVRGGHEIAGFKIDVILQRVWFRQSWGRSWGYNGTFWMSFQMLDDVLGDQGDVIIFTPRTQPAPTPSPDVDAALLAAGNAWEPGIFSRFTKAGKMKSAFDAWKSGHGF